MIVFPYRTDSSVQKIPVVNLIFTGALLIISLLFYLGKLDALIINSVMLSKWSLLRAGASVLIQPDLLSIIFVFLFFFLLGNSVNSTAGNIYYPVILIILCVITAAVHLLASDVHAIGGNGVVSGLAGFSLAILPSNRLIIYRSEQDEDEEGFSVFIIAFLWIAFAVYAVNTYAAIPCFFSQAASFAAGIIIASLSVKFKIIRLIDPTFAEWLNDKLSLLAYVDLLGALMPSSGKAKEDAAAKQKAERLLELVSAEEKNIFDVNGLSEETKEKENEAVASDSPTAENIHFRLLKGVNYKDFITLYFVYEGEEITDVSVKAENYRCEIYPSERLKKGDSGSMKIFSPSPNKINQLSIKLEYIRNNVPASKEIIYLAQSNKIRN